jgi:hypothetical protein
MQRYTLNERQKQWLWAAVGLTALFTAAAVIITASGLQTIITAKIVAIAFMLFCTGISACSGARWLKKHGPLYGMGLVTVIVSAKAFLVFSMLLLGDVSGVGLAKYCTTLIIGTVILGYLCGIATIRTNHTNVYYLKLVAFCGVGVIGLYFIIQVLRIPFYRGFRIDYLFRSLVNNQQSARILLLLLLLSVSFTCMAKAVSRMHDHEPEPEISTIPLPVNP